MPKYLSTEVLRGKALGINVFRGYARLSDLAKISKPDIYDSLTNPNGTQRDLSPKHAREVYEYVKTSDFAYLPEIFLCARDKKVYNFEPLNDSKKIGVLNIDLDIASDPDSIAISRVDGNHRLHYADGRVVGFSPINKTASFCLAYNLSLEEEILLFRDININQRRMNTSHLDNISIRLTPEETLKNRDPALYISQKLADNEDSPLRGLVYTGGKKSPGFSAPLRSLKTGVGYILSRPTRLKALDDPEAQYRVIRNYFSALKKWEPYAWEAPGKYIMLSGAGLTAICYMGAYIIDRALNEGKFEDEDMLEILLSGRKWNWSKYGDFRGLSGKDGAAKISEMVITDFRNESTISVMHLFRKIMGI